MVVRWFNLDLEVGIVGEAHAGRVVTFDELLDAVWGYPPEAGDAAQVRNAVGRLRAKLGDDAGAPRHIATVRGVGYRWMAPPDDISERYKTDTVLIRNPDEDVVKYNRTRHQ